MKRSSVVLEPWTTKEKLCLSSAALRNGDQNWMLVSRALKMLGEQDRPSEWYSQKQCALQYEALLNMATSKRKKRSEKGVEIVDTQCESIVRKLLQERKEELSSLLERDRQDYMRLKKEIEDIESGKLDDRLDEFEKDIEEELEREDLRESKLGLQEEHADSESPAPFENSHEAENKVPVSPLLTSLLQSPSTYRSHSMLSPTSRVSDSPTLSRLLESPAKQLEPTALFSTGVKEEPVEEESVLPVKPADLLETQQSDDTVFVEEIQATDTIVEEIKSEAIEEKEQLDKEQVQDIQEEPQVVQVEEIAVEVSTETEVPVSTSKPDIEEELYGEKEEQEQSSLNTLQESDSMEEQHSIAELDSQMVNMIVAGGGVISVSHDISSEHLEATSDIQHKDSTETTDNSQDGRTSGVVEIDEEINMEGTVVEVGGDMVGAVVVEEEVDTTVHEVELLVSDVNTTPNSSKCLEDEDSTQDGDVKDPESEPQEESQDEDEVDTLKPRNIEDSKKEEKEDDEEEDRLLNITTQIVSRNTDSPNTTEDDCESGKQPTKKRLISGSACSDSKPSSPASHTMEDSKEYRSWKKSIMLVFNRMATHKYASIFLKPITNEQAPAYDSVIHRPVDLSTIKKRIEAGELRTTVEFQRDLLLMFQNAIMYNNCRTLVYEMATIMQNECMQHIELMVEAMGEGVPWRKDTVSRDKLHPRGRGENPKRKRTSIEDSKTPIVPKRRKEPSI